MSRIKQLVPEDVDQFDELDFSQLKVKPNEIDFSQIQPTQG